MLMLCMWICYSMKEGSLSLSLLVTPSQFPCLEKMCCPITPAGRDQNTETDFRRSPGSDSCPTVWVCKWLTFSLRGSYTSTPFQWEAIMAVIFTTGRRAFRLSDWYCVLQKDMIQKGKEVGIVCVYLIRGGWKLREFTKKMLVNKAWQLHSYIALH